MFVKSITPGSNASRVISAALSFALVMGGTPVAAFAEVSSPATSENPATAPTLSPLGDETAVLAVEVYSVSFLSAATNKSTATYTDADTIRANATLKDANGSKVTFDETYVTYQWQQSDAQRGPWTNIEGATSRDLNLRGLGGKYVNCLITAKNPVPNGSYPSNSRSRGQAVTATASTAIDVYNVTGPTPVATEVGTTITGTATARNHTPQDVSTNKGVTWTWYLNTTASTTGGTKIQGATGNSFTIPQDDANYLGKYIYCTANGGNGEVASNSYAGPIKAKEAAVPAKVTLTQVSALGIPNVGESLTATAYIGSKEATEADKVTYQWQYADTKTTTDISFKDIKGATNSLFVIPEKITDASTNQEVSLIGKYLRVKATAANTVASTTKVTYGSERSLVDPLGPVTRKGEYSLSSAELTTSGVCVNDGDTLGVKAKYIDDTRIEGNVPADAKLTYEWYVADSSDRTNVGTKVSTNATYQLSTAQVGKYIYVKVAAGMNTVTSDRYQVAAANTYEFKQINTTKQTALTTGDKAQVSVMAQALQPKNHATNRFVDVTQKAGVTYAWYTSDTNTDTSQWTQLTGLASSTISVPAAAANKYLKVVATSGTSSVSYVFAEKVADKNSVAGAIAVLQAKGVRGWTPAPVFGTDTNVNEILKAYLTEQGVNTQGFTVKVKTAEVTTPANMGISTADTDNGKITYYNVDPSTLSGSFAVRHQVTNLVFTISKDGISQEYTAPSFTMPWDEDKLEEYLTREANKMAITFASGENAQNVTQNLTLPWKAGAAGNTASWTNVEWSSNDEAVAIQKSAWGDVTGKVSRKASDRTVTLTATVSGLSNWDMPNNLDVTKTFEVTVKGDPQKAAEDTAALQEAVKNFTAQSITYMTNSKTTAADGNITTTRLQLPRTRTLGVDGKFYQVTYASNSPKVSINGYAAKVVRPLPGSAAEPVELTLTITDKNNKEVTASSKVAITLAPYTQQEIDDAVNLMSQAKGAYATGLTRGQTPNAVSNNLTPFQKIYLKEGKLTFSYSYAESSGVLGIVPQQLPGYSDMGAYNQARLFKSSNTAVVLNESLQLAWNSQKETQLTQWQPQPTYNKKVTINSVLTDERFEDAAKLYAKDPVWGAKLASLVNQEVAAQLTILGTTGKEDPNPTAVDPTVPQDPKKQVEVRVALIGPDAKGNIVPWVDYMTGKFTPGTTAVAATKAILEQHGYTCDDSGLTFSKLDGSTLPNGKTQQGAEEQKDGTWRYFVVYLNGEFMKVLPSNYELKDGDVISWVWGDGLTSTVDVPHVPNPQDPAKPAQDPAKPAQDPKTTTSSLPTTKANEVWSTNLLDGRAGALSGTTILDYKGKIFTAVGTSLKVTDAQTGKVVTSVALAARADAAGCRPVVVDGKIIIPLHNGVLQAIDATTYAPLWATPALPQSEGLDQQAISNLTVDGTKVIYGTAAAGFNDADLGGWLVCVDTQTGSVVWQHETKGAGYYWSGAALTADGNLIVANDAGTVTVRNGKTGALVSSVELGAAVRSAVVLNDAKDTAYVVTRDNGTLHKLSYTNGKLSRVTSQKFADWSTSTPVLFEGNVYVGAAFEKETGLAPAGLLAASAVHTPVSKFFSYGGLAVMDAATLKVKHVITSAGGAAIPGDVKSTPLVRKVGNAVYAYFTSNSDKSGVYSYKLGDTQATKIYDAGSKSQYSMGSIVEGSDGSLYYANDSGYLFKLATQTNGASNNNNQGDGSKENSGKSQQDNQGAGSTGTSGKSQQDNQGSTNYGDGQNGDRSGNTKSVNTKPVAKKLPQTDDTTLVAPVGILTGSGLTLLIASWVSRRKKYQGR